jgi:hypothetical protein
MKHGKEPFMDLGIIQNNKERLAKSIPVVSRYLDKFHSINTRWAGAIAAGMIETGLMSVEASKLFTPLYGCRATYIYGTAVRDPENDRRTVGIIQIVFDAEPQFQAMLTDVLPRDEKKQIVSGSFGSFMNRQKRVIASTTSDYPVGSPFPLEDAVLRIEKGERRSTVIDLGGRSYMAGLQVSDGYREYKRSDGSVNDVICMLIVPI